MQTLAFAYVLWRIICLFLFGRLCCRSVRGLRTNRWRVPTTFLLAVRKFKICLSKRLPRRGLLQQNYATLRVRNARVYVISALRHLIYYIHRHNISYTHRNKIVIFYDRLSCYIFHYLDFTVKTSQLIPLTVHNCFFWNFIIICLYNLSVGDFKYHSQYFKKDI